MASWTEKPLRDEILPILEIRRSDPIIPVPITDAVFWHPHAGNRTFTIDIIRYSNIEVVEMVKRAFAKDNAA